MHWIQKVGCFGVGVFILGVATLNVIGWLTTIPGVGGAAAAFFAVCFEVMAFVLWETIREHARARKTLSTFGGVVFLIAAVAVNVYGGHQGLEYVAKPLHEQAERNREAAQSKLDNDRAAIELQIAAHQQRIDDVPPADMSGGYKNDEQENARWNDATALDRQQIVALRNQLTATPLVVAKVEPYPPLGPYAISAIFVLVSVFGLSIFGAQIQAIEPKPKRQEAPEGENVIDWETARSKRSTCNVPEGTEWNAERIAMAKQLKAEGLSLRQIGDQLGVSHTTIRRKLNR